MKQNIRSLVLTFIVAFVVLFSSVNVFADQTLSPATNGYKISPVRTDLIIKPGASDEINLYIQNASAAVENLQVVVNDFDAPTNETGYPALRLNGSSSPEHSLKQFVTLPVKTLTLKPGQQQSIAAIIKIPLGSASGGYYGAIRFAPVGASGSKNVNISASVASLVLLTIPGNLSEQLSIAGFGVSQGDDSSLKSLFFSNNNLKAVVRFQNNGNVQEQPFGKIVLKKGSKVLSTFGVNNSTAPGNVLPSSIRRFSVNLNKIGAFGKYKIVGNFGYGSKGQLLSAQSTFYVIPLILIIIAVAVILLIIFLIFFLPRLIRRYNKRVIERATRQR
ncbi:MAG TPA: DUF916 domain-containing protein [Patescibacteria group bacterium]|nr:DUF916 domain-containing protein [Patescibacteria group bacterium]